MKLIHSQFVVTLRRERIPQFLAIFTLLLAAYVFLAMYHAPILFASESIRLTPAAAAVVTPSPVFDIRAVTFIDTPYRQFTVDLTKRQWVHEPLRYLLAGFSIALPTADDAVFITAHHEWALSRTAFASFVEHELAPRLESRRQDVVLSRRENGTISFSTVAVPGHTIDTTTLVRQLLAAFAENKTTIVIPYLDEQPAVTTDAALARIGVRDFLATALMDYSGSSDGRTHNIHAGAEKINGTVIAAGETWSFNDALFPLSVADFVDQPVIKGGTFTPELGGGVCQVSSAVFRAALAAGLPIVERSPHSQKIVYYQPPGLDAAVYPGQKDLKFTNDTGHAIVIQAAASGQTIRVNLYGTRDGRVARVLGPLTPDGVAITDIAAPGMRYLWRREVQRAEKSSPVVEEFQARYRAG